MTSTMPGNVRLLAPRPRPGAVPLADLTAQQAAVATEVAQGWQRVLAGSAFTGGPEVSSFEEKYADFAGVRHCAGVASGTDAIEIALRALGAGPGGECVLPANAFAGAAAAVCRAGATPVLADCADDGTYLLDPAAVAAAVTPRTRVIIPVHLYGQAAPVERLLPLARRAGARVVAGAAHSHGARRGGVSADALGDAAATSFGPGANLGAYGDAGAVLTGSDEIAARVRTIRGHSPAGGHRHELPGLSSRLDALQAVVLAAKLRRLGGWNQARQAAAARYHALLEPLVEVLRPRTLAGNEHVWHRYVVRVPDRDRVLAGLRAAGIGAAAHYPVPIHLMPAFAHLGYRRGDFPAAEQAAAELLSLPLFPGITEGQQERVATELAAALP